MDPSETLEKERRYEVRASACFGKVVVFGKTVITSLGNSVGAWMARRSSVLFDNEFFEACRGANLVPAFLR